MRRYLFPTDVHSHAGGWWNEAPKGWKRNRALAFAVIGVSAMAIFAVSASKEVRDQVATPSPRERE